MVKAGGIDLGGTKIEAQKFDADWNVVEKQRIDTPRNYLDLVIAISAQVSWLKGSDADLPVGIAAAGLANPTTGNWIAANLASDGKPFQLDVANSTGADLVWLNDCRAFTLAEAAFGTDGSSGTMVGLVMGTGIAGGVAIDGKLINNAEGQAGEFGHIPISGDILTRNGLPAIQCGCGRVGCYETYGSGPGLERLAKKLIGRDLSTREIVSGLDDPSRLLVWNTWCDVNAALILTILTVVDPQTIVLGGGISQIEGLIGALEKALKKVAWDGLALPEIRLSTHGETAAALGAAYAAHTGKKDV